MWISRFFALFRREKLAKELDEELQFHVGMRQQRNIAEGMGGEEALRQARLRFGSSDVWRERMTEIDLMVFPQSVLRDLRFGVRALWKKPGSTCAAIFALMIGIGVCTVAFTAYRIFIDAPLNVPAPNTLVNLALMMRSGVPETNFSFPDYVAYRSQAHSFSGMIATAASERLVLTGAEEVARAPLSADQSLARGLGLFSSGAGNKEFALTAIVSENYMPVLGVPLIRGRDFAVMSPEELLASAPVLVSENYWQRRFGSDPSLLGRSIRLNGVPFTITGITPRDFSGTSITVPDFWLPLTLMPVLHPGDDVLSNRERKSLLLRARLAPGVSMNQAQSEVKLLADRLDQTHSAHSPWTKPASALVWRGSAQPYPMMKLPGFGFFVLLMLAVLGIVLGISCANVASLQMARFASRQDEILMRLSLGASRIRVCRQLLTESALLGLIAGNVSYLFTWGLMKLVSVLAVNALPPEYGYGTRVVQGTPDLAIFFYILAISLFSGILLGLAPALESTRAAVTSAARFNAQISPLRGRWLRDILIGAQVAVALVFTIEGSVLVRSAIHGLKADPGFDIRHVTEFDLKVPGAPNLTSEKKLAMVRELRARLSATPGVLAITNANPPFGQGSRIAFASLSGGVGAPASDKLPVSYAYVENDYFDTLNIPVILGRRFGPNDTGDQHSVILSESAARRLWPGKNPLGRAVHLIESGLLQHGNSIAPDGKSYLVVGIARNTRDINLGQGDAAIAYLPMAEGQLADYPILIRSDSDARQAIGMLRAAVSSFDPRLEFSFSTLDEMLRQTPAFLFTTFLATVAALTGFVGLLLASMGIYGTVGYIAALRTREVGLRMALGAKRRDILGLMLSQVGRPTLGGLLMGMILASLVTTLLHWALHDLVLFDSFSFVGVSLLFFSIALFAAYLPARRSVYLNPVDALRCE